MKVLRLPSGGAVFSVRTTVAVTRRDLEAIARRVYATRRKVRSRNGLLKETLDTMSSGGTDALAELYFANLGYATRAKKIVKRLFPELYQSRLAPSTN